MRVNMVMYFVFIYENRMKPAEIVPKGARGKEGEKWRG
jgi:hypothetical protein